MLGSLRSFPGLWLGALLTLSAPAAEAKIHALSGNLRLQVGYGLPAPITVTPAPGGRIQAVPGATLRQHGVHAASQPARVVLDPAQLTHPGTPFAVPILLGGGALFQLKTALPFQFPKSKIQFSAGGRTGAPTVTFCPGQSVTTAGNPACASASAGVKPGLLRYTRTSQQFGGPAFLAVQGSANVALRVSASAPCGLFTPSCLAIFAPATPAVQAAGAPFGFSNRLAGAAPSPGLFQASVSPAGRILAMTATGMGPGLSNPVTSYGGPWTTGRVTVVQPGELGVAQTFVFSGSDGRAASVSSTLAPSSQTPNGTGALSLVAGAVSSSLISGPQATRGWLNLTVGPRLSHVPLLPAYGVAAAVGLVALSGAFVLHRHRRR